MGEKHRQLWEPILTQWGSEMDLYYNRNDDEPFGYDTEGPMKGFLMAAILRASQNSTVLWEYNYAKIDGGTGRVDICTNIGQRLYLIEAKTHRQSCHRTRICFSQVPALMDKAFDQISEYEESVNFEVAAVFVIPYVAENESRFMDQLREQILKTQVETGQEYSGVRADYYPDISERSKDERFGVTLFLTFRDGELGG